MKSPKILVISALLSLLAVPALAQSSQTMQGMQGMQGQGGMQGQAGMQGMQGMNMQGMGHMMGMHQMSATVTSVDINTGIMEVTSDGMKLRLHFPPASLASLKAGDKVMLHLGFMKQ